jgi:hypothetical protein
VLGIAIPGIVVPGIVIPGVVAGPVVCAAPAVAGAAAAAVFGLELPQAARTVSATVRITAADSGVVRHRTRDSVVTTEPFRPARGPLV